MTTPASSEGGTGSDSQLVITDEILGNCVWCGHFLMYLNPGDPPADCEVTWSEFYRRPQVFRNFALIDYPLDYGEFCPAAPPHPLGQYSVHQLRVNKLTP